jgi:hypothetical protein
MEEYRDNATEHENQRTALSHSCPKVVTKLSNNQVRTFLQLQLQTTMASARFAMVKIETDISYGGTERGGIICCLQW